MSTINHAAGFLSSWRLHALLQVQKSSEDWRRMIGVYRWDRCSKETREQFPGITEQRMIDQTIKNHYPPF